MIHPLLKLLATQPGLLLNHMAVYAELMAMQMKEGIQAFQRRLILIVIAGTCAISSLIFLGVAGVVAATVPLKMMPAPLLLIAVPVLLAGIALICWLVALRQKFKGNFNLLLKQARLDVGLINQSLGN